VGRPLPLPSPLCGQTRSNSERASERERERERDRERETEGGGGNGRRRQDLTIPSLPSLSLTLIHSLSNSLSLTLTHSHGVRAGIVLRGVVQAPNAPQPHGGVRPFHQKSTCLKQLTLEPCVVQIWSRNPRISEATKPSNSTVFKARGLLYHSTLGLRGIKKKKTPPSGTRGKLEKAISRELQVRTGIWYRV